MESIQNPLKTVKVQERLAQVVKIAHRLFASRGYEEVGIREIANVSRSKAFARKVPPLDGNGLKNMKY